MKRFTIDCRMYAEADTIEEAVKRLKEQLNAMSGRIGDPALPDEWKAWRAECPDERDWIAHNFRKAFSSGVLWARDEQ